MNSHMKSYYDYYLRIGSPVDYCSEARQPTTPAEQVNQKAIYWLISLAALISLLVGFLWLHYSVEPRTPGTDQLNLVAEGAPSHVEVTIDEALQSVSMRH
jgi:hypothetical protein